MQKTGTKKVLLNIAVVCFWFAQYVYVPYQTPYLFSMGAASSLVGVVVGAYGFSQMLLRIPVGILADIRSRHKRFILIGILCSALASVLRVLFAHPGAFLAANLLSGVASSMWISYTVFYSSLYREDELKKAMGYLIAANNGGIVLGFLAGTLLNDYLGISYVFLCSTAAGLLGFIIALFIREEPAQAADKKIRSLKELQLGAVFKSKPLIFFSVLGVLIQAISLATTLSFTTSYAKQITSQDFALGVCAMIFIVMTIVVSFFIGKLKGSNSLLLSLAFGLQLAYCVLVPLTHAMWQLYILQAVAGMSNGVLMTLLMALAMAGMKKENKSTATGIFMAAYSLGMTLGPMLMGVLVGSGGYLLGFWALGVLALAGVVIVLAARNKAFLK